jgi:hypothetical protein
MSHPEIESSISSASKHGEMFGQFLSGVLVGVELDSVQQVVEGGLVDLHAQQTVRHKDELYFPSGRSQPSDIA